jgi:hypothetical protein
MTTTLHTPHATDHLDVLESHALFILREVVAECERPVLLFSGGKDSAVLLHLAAKAFAPQQLPFPVLHIDTGQNFAEVLEFRAPPGAAARGGRGGGSGPRVPRPRGRSGRGAAGGGQRPRHD